MPRHTRWYIALVSICLLLAGCGSSFSKDVYTHDYFNAAGVKGGTEYPLLTLQAEQTPGSVGNTAQYVTVGKFQENAPKAVAESIRFKVKVHDQRINSDSTVTVDFPMSRINWQVQTDVAPKVVFNLVANTYSYTLKHEDESIWSHTGRGLMDNLDKDTAINNYDKSPSELFSAFATSATITVTPGIDATQVQPILAGNFK